MNQTFRIARVLGVDIRVDVSALAIVGFVTWVVSTGTLPEVAPGYSALEYWLFAALLAHELSHSVVANQRGIKVRAPERCSVRC